MNRCNIGTYHIPLGHCMKRCTVWCMVCHMFMMMAKCFSYKKEKLQNVHIYDTHTKKETTTKRTSEHNISSKVYAVRIYCFLICFGTLRLCCWVGRYEYQMKKRMYYVAGKCFMRTRKTQFSDGN